MESGSAARARFPAERECRSGNGGNESAVAPMPGHRRIVADQAKRFRLELELATAGRDRDESGRPD